MEKGSSSSTSSSSSAAAGGAADGLKFGKTIYFEGCGKSGSPQSPAKKGRTSGVVPGGSQPPRCQVEGCKVDLSDAKAYYSRHKVCVMHSKSATVIVAGLEQRFCQQCSRFHQLPEFDQGKRSCRRRLAGHNERRRKPPPGSLLSPRCGTLCPPMFDNGSKSTSGFVMDFSSYPTSLTGRDSWPSTWNQSNSPNFVSDPLQGTVITRLGYSPGPRPGPGVASQACFNGVSDSSSALSLLSNQLWGSRTHSLSLGSNNYLGSNGQPMVQPPSVPLGQYGCTTWGFKGDQGSHPLHDMASDLGLGQTSQSSQYTGELGLAQPSEGQFHELDTSRGYDSSVQHVHWTL